MPRLTYSKTSTNRFGLPKKSTIKAIYPNLVPKNNIETNINEEDESGDERTSQQSLSKKITLASHKNINSSRVNSSAEY